MGGNFSIESTGNADPRITEAVNNLKMARMNNELTGKKYWENRLIELTNSQPVRFTPLPFKGKKETGNVSGNSEALNVTKLTNQVIVANSVSRDIYSGIVFAAIGIYGGPDGGDTLKVFRSSNNGLNFTPIYSLSAVGFRITNNGLDIEALNKGDSSFAFLSMSYSFMGFNHVAIVRVRQDGERQMGISLIGSTTNKYLNGRMTSDIASYSAAAYIYLSSTLDSTVDAYRGLKSKLYRLTNPYEAEDATANIIACYQDATNGQYGYYVGGSAPTLARLESDIAYVNTVANADQLYTVTVVTGVPGLFGDGSGLYFTRSSDFGATVSLFNITDPGFLKASPRIAATGFRDNTMMVVTNRLLSAGNWDPYYFYIPNININEFNGGFVNSQTDTTLGVSVTAKYKSNGGYLFSYNNRVGFNGSNIFMRPFSAGSLGTNVQANPPDMPGTTIFGLPDAGFRNVNNDSCMVVWGGTVGIGSYITGGCGGDITSIGSSNTNLSDFHLYQNYPNPFNPSTKISYNLSRASKVSVRIFDIVGKEVALIVNEIQSTGFHSVEFNGINLSSGIYFYKIEANDFVDTKRMVLIK